MRLNAKKKESRKWLHYRKQKAVIKAQDSEKVDTPPKAVLFVQNTPNGELASDIKKIIADLRPWTGLNVKVVERGGTKIQDLLCKSNPWDNSDCSRIDCFTCSSSARSDKPNYKSCYRRSVVYETWCNTCLTKTSREIEPERDTEETVVKNVSVNSVIDEIGGEVSEAHEMDKKDKI